MSQELSSLPTLGVGLGFRDIYGADVLRHRKSIDFLEIVADHYFTPDRVKQTELEALSSLFPLIPHGLSLSLGSAEGLYQPALKHLKRLIAKVKPTWWSEHISWTRSGEVDIGHLSPLPFSREALTVLRQNIQVAKATIDVPLILENVTYDVQVPGADLDEASFLGEVCDQNDCGLLLDVTNLYTNSVNHRFDPIAFLHRLPLDRIVQLHFVGGHWRGERLIDSHSSSTPEEVWQLLEEVLRLAPIKGIILERDENLPPIEELLTEIGRARASGTAAGRWSSPDSSPVLPEVCGNHGTS